jgi:hypothetical protein
MVERCFLTMNATSILQQRSDGLGIQNIIKSFELDYLNVLQNKDNTRQPFIFVSVYKKFTNYVFSGKEKFKTGKRAKKYLAILMDLCSSCLNV